MAFSVGVLRWRSGLIAFQAEDRDFVNPFWYLPRSERRSVPSNAKYEYVYRLG